MHSDNCQPQGTRTQSLLIRHQPGSSAFTIDWGLVDTPFGTALIGSCDRGICHLSFTDEQPLDGAHTLQTLWPQARLRADHHAMQHLAEPIFQPGGGDHHYTLLVNASAFQCKVWQGLLQTAPGHFLSYSQLAERCGHPAAARAVGSAVAANPIAVLIPCHRVIRADGQLGQFRWGQARKRALQHWETAMHQDATATTVTP